MIDMQAPLVLRFGGQKEPVRAVVPEVLDDLPQRCLAIAFVLLVFVNHKAPEPVAVILILFFGVKGEHAEAHKLLICIDGKGPGHARLLRVGLIGLPQGNVIRSDERLILPHGKGQNGISVIIIDGHQSYIHMVFLHESLCCSLSNHSYILSAEKGHNNTAAKQLPLWLRPAVSTIRSYLYAAH